MENFEMWYVYILYKNKIPVYAGCTNNIKKRIIYQHKRTKDFDQYRIFYQCGFKEKCLEKEKTIVDFILDHYPNTTYVKQKRSFMQDSCEYIDL